MWKKWVIRGEESCHQKEECDVGIILDKLPFVQPVKSSAAAPKTTEPVQCLGNPFLLLKRIQVKILLEVSWPWLTGSITPDEDGTILQRLFINHISWTCIRKMHKHAKLPAGVRCEGSTEHHLLLFTHYLLQLEPHKTKEDAMKMGSRQCSD